MEPYTAESLPEQAPGELGPDPDLHPRLEPGPGGWPPWSAPAALFAGILLAAVGGLVVDIPAALLFGVKISSENLPGGLEILDTAVQDLAFVAAVVFFAQMGGRGLQAWQLGLRPTRLWPAVGAVVLTILGFLVFEAIWASALEVSTKEKLLEQLGSNSSTLLLLASAALTCVMAPICEEILFRGYFFAALSNWKGWLPAAVLTGVVFGGVHAGSAPAVDLIPLGVLGFALCVLYRWTGSLYPCIATHIVNNCIAFGALEDWGVGQTALLLLAALGSAAGIALALRRVGVIGDPPEAILAGSLP
jgi:membrane protease YdiL (CAAX protease family)